MGMLNACRFIHLLVQILVNILAHIAFLPPCGGMMAFLCFSFVRKTVGEADVFTNLFQMWLIGYKARNQPSINAKERNSCRGVFSL
jgi:hypothetical protein